MIVSFKESMLDYIQDHLIESGESIFSLIDLMGRLNLADISLIKEMYQLAKIKDQYLALTIKKIL